MPTNSRKTLKAAPPDKPKRNNVNFILSDEEQRRIQAEMVAISRSSGMPVRLGTYAKHALLSHLSMRGKLARLRELIKEWDREADGILSCSPGEIAIATKVKAILGAA